MSNNVGVLELYQREDIHKTLVEVDRLDGCLPADYKAGAFIFKAMTT
jgi:hypothetical protein